VRKELPAFQPGSVSADVERLRPRTSLLGRLPKVHHVLKEGRAYEELCGDYFDRLEGEWLTHHLPHGWPSAIGGAADRATINDRAHRPTAISKRHFGRSNRRHQTGVRRWHCHQTELSRPREGVPVAKDCSGPGEERVVFRMEVGPGGRAGG
jgi:hypothetical protein